MAWEVEYTDEFGAWWLRLTDDEQVSVAASVQWLELKGPALPFPHSSGWEIGGPPGEQHDQKIQ
jgi:hypothetical protein